MLKTQNRNSNLRYILVLYQKWKTVFDHISKHVWSGGDEHWVTVEKCDQMSLRIGYPPQFWRIEKTVHKSSKKIAIFLRTTEADGDHWQWFIYNTGN